MRPIFQMNLKAFEKKFGEEFSVEVQLKVKTSTALANDQPSLEISYILSGPLNLLEIPAREKNPQGKEGLWETTCFEAFFSTPGSFNYKEFNFSPSGNWWIGGFENYRVRSNEKNKTPSPRLSWAQKSDNLAELNVVLNSAHFDKGFRNLEWSLAAILKLKTGEKIHFALEHLAEKPDFHIRSSFKAQT